MQFVKLLLKRIVRGEQEVGAWFWAPTSLKDNLMFMASRVGSLASLLNKLSSIYGRSHLQWPTFKLSPLKCKPAPGAWAQPATLCAQNHTRLKGLQDPVRKSTISAVKSLPAGCGHFPPSAELGPPSTRVRYLQSNQVSLLLSVLEDTVQSSSACGQLIAPFQGKAFWPNKLSEISWPAW
jgi:hypothetical protein